MKKDHLKKAFLIALISLLGFVLLFFWDNARKIKMDGEGRAVLERGEKGAGTKNYDLTAKVDGKEERIQLELKERDYKEEEVEKLFEQAREKLDQVIIGKNKSMDEVTEDLDLITEIPETGIRISWETEPSEIIDSRGRINDELTIKEGTIVKLTAQLKYGSYTELYELYGKIFPPKRSVRSELQKELEEEEARTKTETGFVLPDEAGGKKIEWNYTVKTRAFLVLAVGGVLIVFLSVSEEQKKKERQKKREKELLLDYPKIVNKLCLYISAGMTMRTAWFRMTDDYEKKKEGKETENKAAYEEMIYTSHQIAGGMSEAECYEAYGKRCGTLAYRKLGILLSQNLRKGAKGLTDLLSSEAEEAFEERKNAARKLGEEAGTKLMIPMFMMLLAVFIMIIVPAFFSIQIE